MPVPEPPPLTEMGVHFHERILGAMLRTIGNLDVAGELRGPIPGLGARALMLLLPQPVRPSTESPRTATRPKSSHFFAFTLLVALESMTRRWHPTPTGSNVSRSRDTPVVAALLTGRPSCETFVKRVGAAS